MQTKYSVTKLLREAEAYASQPVQIGEEKYSSKIDELVNDLKSVKDNLKKGPNKKFFRKEASRIQSAIQTLRYLKRKSEKLAQKNNNKIMMSESEIIELVQKKGIIHVEYASKKYSFSGQGGVADNLSKAAETTSDLLGIQKAKERLIDTKTKNLVIKDIKSQINKNGLLLINDIKTRPIGTGGVIPIELTNIVEGSSLNPFTAFVFYDVISIFKHIICTHSATTTASSSVPGVPYLVSTGYPMSSETNNNLRNIITKYLNIIIEKFNALFEGVSDIPKNAGYTSQSVYNFRNDLLGLLNGIRNSGSNMAKLDTKFIINSLDNNLLSKQEPINPLSNKKTTPSSDNIKNLAKSISSELLQYYIDSLNTAKDDIVILSEFANRISRDSSTDLSLPMPFNSNIIVQNIEKVTDSLSKISLS